MTSPYRQRDTLTIARPDDAHLHLRDGALLRTVLKHSAERFSRAIIMPNLPTPVDTVAKALAYRERILSAMPTRSTFTPLMTLYLTDSMAVEEIDRAVNSGVIYAVKYYPAGATTHSRAGVSQLENCSAVLERMETVSYTHLTLPTILRV